MGSLSAGFEHRSSFCARARDPDASVGLLCDENLPHLGSDRPARRGNGSLPAPGAQAQVELLAELIGGREADARELARDLVERFGSLGRVFAASQEAIERNSKTPGIGRRISAAREAVLAGQRENIARTVFDLRDPRLQLYIVGLFQGTGIERLQAVFLDAGDRYLADDQLTEGTAGQVTGNLRALVNRAFDLGAAGVVLAHNHPSGDASPSPADVQETRKLKHSLAALDLQLVDHLIVGGTTIHSMRGAGLL